MTQNRFFRQHYFMVGAWPPLLAGLARANGLHSFPCRSVRTCLVVLGVFPALYAGQLLCQRFLFPQLHLPRDLDALCLR